MPRVTSSRQASTAAILLRHYAWNAEKLQEQFWNDPAAALESAGLDPPSSPSASTSALPPTPSRRGRTKSSNPSSPIKRSRSNLTGPFECPVCCTDYPASQVEKETFALGCGHQFCKGCWNEYLGGKISQEGESAKIQCMESGCHRIVREEVVDSFVDDRASHK
jgi:ariadne-1